jgi:hypothetical protein
MLYVISRRATPSIKEEFETFLQGIKSVMTTIALFLLSPFLPLVIITAFIINYVTISKFEKEHRGIKSIFLYTCAIFYKLAFVEMCQFIDKKGDLWLFRTRRWSSWSQKIQRPVHMLLLCEVIGLTYFVGEDINEKTERSTIYKQYVKAA